ncbi:MAG: cysteine--tRNA ligase [Acidobacteria bacterium]|nr:MAG: cysteine--tRNA ligase [Acidobacteriota bacterium]PIE89726.1 MAG: cysteine--tRNA ligase [Acidobacteriota bacterium]
MSLTVQNTMTNKRETFVPMEEGKVSMYACGVTVYDVCHIGHGMQAIVYDVIRNYLNYKGYEVTYVRNYTDVDDKIIQRAKELGVSALEHSERMIQEADRDLASLGVRPADIEPKVSDHIPEIVDLIQKIIENGGAYAAGGDVYFDVKSFPQYGCLSNRSSDDMQAGVRVEVNPNKRDPADFALWKKAKEGEVSWPSPWGEGRPGWHIECSALAMKYLGMEFDIHGGGRDLIFPHHENEIAQSVKGTSKSFARYWIHNGLVKVGGRKMSKSFHNFLSIRDAVEKYYPETIRYTILSHHYSGSIDFSEKSFYDAYHRLLYFYNTFNKIDQMAEMVSNYPEHNIPGFEMPAIKEDFIKAMDDDFSTAQALAKVGSVFKTINDLIAAKKPKMKMKIHTLLHLKETLLEVLSVLGIGTKPPKEALSDIQTYLIKSKHIDCRHVEQVLQQREEARKEKNWSRADELRDQLLNMGIAIMDTPQGTQWQVLP